MTNVAPFWECLDDCHFDLNTCLRETIVLLKSFLVAIPENELDGFEQTYRAQVRAAHPSQPDRSRLLRHRRIAQIAGE
jgi:trans-aconitate methyltransferase